MEEKILFPLAGEDHPYAGMPLFDGEKEHFDAYLDALLEYAGMEGALLWANEYRHDYVLTTGAHAGHKIPGTLFWGPATDSVQGYQTDFPCMVGLGQSWNRALVKQAGEVIGREYVGQTDHSEIDSSKFSAMICTAMQDMRINPLSGRFDEGFSEDPMLSSELVNEMAKGAAGTEDPKNPDGFWERCCVVTKHFTTYGGQTFRMAQSNDISIRGLMEHQIKAPLKGVASGALSGFMMSFGRTNGVPNTISPAISYLQKLSPYGLYSTPDIFGTSMFWNENTYRDGHGNFSNHYDKSYLKPEYKTTSAALMAHAECGGYIMTPETVEAGMKELLDIAAAGVAEVTKEEICRSARNNLAAYVRLGFLNAVPEDNPFLEDEKHAMNSTDPLARETALAAARESIVLLKNNGLLPLSGKEQIALSGPFADARFKTVYAARNLPELPDCGLTVRESLTQAAEQKGGRVAYHSDGKCVKLRVDGSYLMIRDTDPDSETFGKIGFTDDSDEAEIFEQFSWGQARAFSYKSTKSGLWFSSNGVQENFLAPIVPTELKVNENMSLIMKNTTLSGVLSGITLPTRVRWEENGDGSLRFLIHGFNESLLQFAPDAYYKMGRYVIRQEDELLFTEPLTSPEHAEQLREQAAKIEIETVKEIGSDTIHAKEEAEVAVVVIGAATRHSAGEGVDRSELAMGEDCYELVHRVAEAYPKKTVVIVNSSFPVLMKEIQEDSNVAAILYQPYAGQYDGYAMGEVVFGDYAPTGRLTATWYASEDALPKLDSYSVPEGPDSEHRPDTMDPRLHVDFRKQDLIAEKLTYQYSDAEATYHMGHGGSYSSFVYENLTVADWENPEEPLQIWVDITNTGKVDTAEVIQVYMTNPDSAYGKAAPKQTLAGFEKIWLKAGETRTVSMEIHAEDISLWDVNRGAYILEEGRWIIQVGHASDQILLMDQIRVYGDRLAVLDPSREFSLFGKTYLADQVTYRERGKQNTIEALMKQDGKCGMDQGYFSIMSKQAGAWAALKQVDLTGKTEIEVEIAATQDKNYLEIRLDSPDGLLLAMLATEKTEPIFYIVPNTGTEPERYPSMPVNELGYRTVSAKLLHQEDGIHDIYVVFGNSDLRVGNMKIS